MTDRTYQDAAFAAQNQRQGLDYRVGGKLIVSKT